MTFFDTTGVAWAAGFFDGEGCTTMQRQKRGTILPVIDICQAADLDQDGPPAVLRKFNRVTGGRGAFFCQMKDKVKSPSHRLQWSLRFSGYAEVIAVICQLWPELGDTKKKQAYRVLQEYLDWKSRPGSPRSWRCPNGHTRDLANLTPANTCRTCHNAGSHQRKVA